MLQEAQGWENVPERQKCVVEYDGKLPLVNFFEFLNRHLITKVNKHLNYLSETISSNENLVLTVDVDGCENVDILEV
jgi:hypothetical protein